MSSVQAAVVQLLGLLEDGVQHPDSRYMAHCLRPWVCEHGPSQEGTIQNLFRTMKAHLSDSAGLPPLEPPAETVQAYESASPATERVERFTHGERVYEIRFRVVTHQD
jgi:hypothetical protein